MKRVINVRLPLFCALGIVLGVYSGYEFYFGNYWAISVSVVVIFLLGVLFTVLKCRKKTHMTALLLLVFLLLGFFLLQNAAVKVLKSEETGRTVTVCGRVCDIGRNGNAKNTLYLENCSDENGEKFGGRIKVTLYGGDEFVCGEIVTLKGSIYSVYPLKDRVDTSYARIGLRYELTDAVTLAREDGGMRLDEKIRYYVFSAAQEFMPNNAGVAYALLTGDRNAIDTETTDIYEKAGVVHLLAVSGLHVGFIVTLICLLIKRFKLRPLAELAVILPPLVFYAYICGFSPSVSRALIMLICSYATKALASRYDILSSLSLSVAIILIISPLSLFDAGFQLSALSVYGLATFGTFTQRAVSRRKFNKFTKYLITSISASLSCTLATFCVTVYNFSYAPILGVFTNLIAVPLVSAAFAFCALGLLPWVFRYLLTFADILLQGVNAAAQAAASLSFAVVFLSVSAFSWLIVSVWLFGAGGYIRLGKIAKGIFHSVCAAVLCCSLIFSAAYERSADTVFISVGYSSSVVGTADTKGSAVFVGDFSDGYTLTEVYERVKNRKIRDCVIYITDYSSCRKENLQLIAENFPLSKAYVLDRSGNDGATEYFNSRNVPVIYAEKNTSVGKGGVYVQSFYDGAIRGAVVDFYGVKIAALCGETGKVESLTAKFSAIDLIVAPKVTSYPQNATLLTRYQSEHTNNYGANKYGNFTIEKNNGRIYLKFRRGA